jgi:flavin reductase (DIM6/NTAB) family NADH-FMN oxidoreductase RutF
MSIDRRAFRDALGCFATGVCVITANPEGREPFGVTANSFASVSLDPPLVLWSLQNDSELFGAWEQTKRYAINILRSDQQSLSGHYAIKGDHLLVDDHYEIGASGVPVMPDTLVSFECEREASYPAGDHLIILGRVLEMTNRHNGSPLLFCSGSYHELA